MNGLDLVLIKILDKLGGGGGGQVATGTFVSSTVDGIVEIDVGFMPEVVVVRFDLSGTNTNIGTDTTLAVYHCPKDVDRSKAKSTWELKPKEGVSYLTLPVDTSPAHTAAITGVTETGFKFKSGAANTAGVPCSYIAASS